MFKFLWSISKKYRVQIALITLVGVVYVLLALVFVWLSKQIIDIATGERSGNLLYHSVLLVVNLILQIACAAADIRLRNMTQVRLGNEVRRRVFSHLLYTRWQDLSALHSGDVLTRIIRDTDDVVDVVISSLPLAITALLQFLGAILFLYVLSPILALILGVSMPMVAMFSKAYYRRMRKYTLEIKESESHITSLMEESLLNQVVIRTFERQESKLDRVYSLQSELQSRVKKRTNVSVYTNVLLRTAFSGGYVAAFIWSAFELVKKAITFGTVTAYLQLVSRIQRPLFDLIRILPNIIAAKAASERLCFLIGFEQERVGESIFLSGMPKLSINDVSFAYDNKSANVLSHFSLHASAGQMIAVMGETGSGKTTLLRLLLALIKPSAGTIRVSDETHCVEVSEHTRSNFVYVPQGNSLFSGTIRDNLLIGDPDADDARLTDVLRMASASFVFELPQGLDTMLGEKGSSLSEGQAQRIAIARSLLRPGKIILLDEATSALDMETERRFLNNLKDAMGDRIILFITHQREVAAFCDKVVTID